MRYFELIEQKEVTADAPATGKGKRTKEIRIPAGSGPVQVYVRDGEIFVISAQPLDRSAVP